MLRRYEVIEVAERDSEFAEVLNMRIVSDVLYIRIKE